MKNPIEKTRGWLLPDHGGRGFAGGLYLVATPIGNLRDISVRALDVLAAADLVACEDTRVTGKLLAHYGLSKKLVSYNDHSDSKQREVLMLAVRDGQIVALVSDAGMPLISDPGYKLVRAMQEAGLNVTSVPGASATLSAMQLSGLPSDKFAFIGFLPSKSQARRDVLTQWRDAPASLIAFESAKRLLKALADIDGVMGERRVVVARELTKMYEELRSGAVAELLVHYEEHGAPKGEIVLVIAPPEGKNYTPDALEALLKAALDDGMSTKDAAGFVAQETGAPRKGLYDMALKIGAK